MISSCVSIEYPLPNPEQKKMNNKLAVILARKPRIRISLIGCRAPNRGEAEVPVPRYAVVEATAAIPTAS